MEELKKIFMSIPSDKNKLFSVPIDWALFATSNLLERKVRPWLVNKCIEYLGEEEKVFIDAIIKRLINKETP
jgi:RNA-binding protein 25